MANASLAMRLHTARFSEVRDKLLTVVVNASTYVDGLMTNATNTDVHTVAQISQELNDYRNALEECNLAFREAVVVEGLIAKGGMRAYYDYYHLFTS